MSGQHAKLSPSGAARWTNCPGSVAAEAVYPDDTNVYAAEGTVAHDISAQCIEGGVFGPSDFLGEVMHADGFDIEVDRDMVHFVETYIDQVRACNRTADATFVETRVPIGHITGEQGARGTADFVGIEFTDEATIVRVHDLKYGQGVRVEAENNLQLALYALGVVEEFDYLLEGNVTLELHIHQVRLDHLPVWRLDITELRQLGVELRAAAKRCTPEAPRIPGESQCRFCKHRRACPELRAMIDATVEEEPPRDAESVAAALPRLKLIRDWCATVEARAIELLEQGHAVPGFKLVEGRRSRAWKADPAKVERALRYKTDLKKGDLYTQKLVSVAQAEKLVPKPEWKRIEKLVEYRPGNPTIAPVTDSRPALNVAEAMGFDDLTETQEDWTA